MYMKDHKERVCKLCVVHWITPVRSHIDRDDVF